MKREAAAPAHAWHRTSFGFAFAVCVFGWALARYVQLRWVGLGFGFDVGLYERYGQSWGSGQVPYVDFHPEYPAGALAVFVAPWLSGGARAYANAFAVEMALFDLLALGCVLAWARRLWPRDPARPIVLGIAYVVLTGALYPVLYTRFDLAPGALTILAIYLLYAPRRAWLGGVVLGIAGAVKLWPLALAPLFAGVALRRRGVGGAFKMGGCVVFGAILPALGMLPFAGSRLLEFLEYHEARGIQIESTWATVSLILHAAHLIVAAPVHEYGAFHVRGPVPDALAALSMKVTVVMALAPQVAAFFYGGLGRERDARGEVGLSACCGAVLGFMVGGKVLSPQYMMWLVPLLVPCARRALPLAAALAAAVLTTVVYPYLSPALELQAPGHGYALLALGGRNLLLLAFYGVLFLNSLRGGGIAAAQRSAAQRARAAPARAESDAA